MTTPGGAPAAIVGGPASPISRADDAAAILAARQNIGGRVLGAVNPGPSPTRQSLTANALTANATITAAGASFGPVVAGNAGIVIGSPSAPSPSDGTSSSAVASAVSLPLTAAVSGAGVNTVGVAPTPLVTSAPLLATPATTGAALTAGQFAAGSGTLTPTVNSAALPSPVVAATPLTVTSASGSVIAPQSSLTTTGITFSSGSSTGVTSIPAGMSGTSLPSMLSSSAIDTTRTRAANAPVASTSAATTQTRAATSAPAVSGRGRAVRLTSGAQGEAVITNVTRTRAASNQ